MFTDNKKPTVLGFKPSDADWVKVQELVTYYNDKQVIGSVSVTDVLKMALNELYKATHLGDK